LRDAGADWIVKDCASVHVGETAENSQISLLLSTIA
jgi:hypothetical protein